MKAITRALCFCICFACHSSLAAAIDDQQADGGLRVGDAAPGLRLAEVIQGPGSDALSAQNLRGKVVVVDFWTTWCGACLNAFPHLNGLAEELADEPVVIVSLSNENRDAVEGLLLKRPLNTIVAIDDDNATFSAWGVRILPHTFVIDTEGKVAASTQPEYVTAEAIRDVLAGKPIDLPALSTKTADTEWDTHSIVPPDSEDTVAQAILQRSQAATAAVSFGAGAGRITGDGLTLGLLIQLAYDAQPHEVEESFPQYRDGGYRISIKAPDGERSTAQAMLRSLLHSAFAFEAEWRDADREVIVLSAIGKRNTEAICASTGEAGANMARAGAIQLTSASMEQLAEIVGTFGFGRPGVDETKRDGKYDVNLSWIPGDSESLTKALADAGIRVEIATRPIPILFVGPAEK